MKKIAMLVFCFFYTISFAWEVQLKTGYDFYRGDSKVTVGNSNGKENGHDYNEKGFTLGLEFLTYNNGLIKTGLGIEYNFGTSTPFYDKKSSNGNGNRGYTIPTYLLGKVNILKSSDDKKALYAFGRLGYAFSTVGTPDIKKYPQASGLYYGAGLGFEIKYFVFEGIYDGVFNIRQNTKQKKSATLHFNHKVGIRVGFKFEDWSKKPMINPQALLPQAPIVIFEPKPKPKPKVIKTYGRLIHATCSEEEKSCVIHGFNIDKGIPNEEQKENIKEIVALINEFSASGYIEIIGHTDSIGSQKYNEQLSLKRAESVAMLLGEAGLSSGLVISSISGSGGREPMATNKTRKGRYLNRRVELKFKDLLLEKVIIE